MKRPYNLALGAILLTAVLSITTVLLVALQPPLFVRQIIFIAGCSGALFAFSWGNDQE